MQKFSLQNILKLKVVRILLWAAIIGGFVFSVSGVAVAQFGEPFGGLSYYAFTCTCSGNVAIYFDDLTEPMGVTLPLIYQPGATEEYEFYMAPYGSSWILGLYTQGGTCKYYVGSGCSVLQTAGTMSMVGSSMGS